MKLPQEDLNIINIIKTYKVEYYDEYLKYDSRERVFWNLSCVRQTALNWYPIESEDNVLIVGDDFGAITGSVSEKAGRVDVLVFDKQYSDAIACRFEARDNINIRVVGETSVGQLLEKYNYAIVYLEDCLDFDWQNSYQIDAYLDIVRKHISSEAKLLVMARGDKEYDLKRILFASDFKFQNVINPAGNGFIVIEASQQSFGIFEIADETVSFNRNQLVDCQWARTNYMPQGGGEVIDQDINIIADVKKVEIDLLEKLIEFCNKHSLRVYPIYGTLLGVMRDGGFIEGDDDVDVAMPRADFEKLIELGGEFTDEYFLQTPYNENCFYGGYLKFRNRLTTAINPQNEFVNVCEGIGIDIFPLDEVCANGFVEKLKNRSIRFLQRLLFAKAYGYFRSFRDMPLLIWKGYKYLGKLFDKKKLVDKLYAKMSKGEKQSGRYAIYCHYGSGRLDAVRYFERKAFKKSFVLSYEGVTFDVPVGWESILTSLYGEGYAERPGFNEWKSRHGFYDVNTPYDVYKKRFSGLQYPSTITDSIVLFGDGSVFEGCLKYYKSRVNITYLVQLPNEPEMDSVMGMKVFSWDEFEQLGIPKDSYRAIICSGNSRAAEQVLKEKGYEDYYIFWYNRFWMLYANQSAVWAEIERS